MRRRRKSRADRIKQNSIAEGGSPEGPSFRFWFCCVRETRKLVIFEKRVVGLSRTALARFVVRACRAAGLRGSVNVLVTSSAEMKSLNRRFRDQDEATDVLSFPAVDTHGHRAGRSARPAQKEFAGEIAISADIAAQNARALGHAAAVEIKILTLHGILHLRGYDHEHDRGQMARREQKLREDLHLPSGLIERTQTLTGAQDRRRRA